MGNHRAVRRDSGREVSETPNDSGKRRATKHAAARGRLFRALPSAPVLVGIAALVVSAGGAITAAEPDDLGPVSHASAQFAQANALTGSSSVSGVSAIEERQAAVSRDSRRDALEDAADKNLLRQAEAQAKQRNVALAQFAKKAEQQAAKIARNQWVLPVESYRITATFGQSSGLWSNNHTGLDFAAPSGTPIRAIANGVITKTGYEGSYGNTSVLTLEDGTELWFSHQTSFAVGSGEAVRAGEVIGYVGSTGNSTGPHLHVEVRPGAGDPVDPFEAFVVHGITP